MWCYCNKNWFCGTRRRGRTASFGVSFVVFSLSVFAKTVAIVIYSSPGPARLNALLSITDAVLSLLPTVVKVRQIDRFPQARSLGVVAQVRV